MAEKKQTPQNGQSPQTTISRTSILRNRPKKFDTKYKEQGEQRKYPPKNL